MAKAYDIKFRMNSGDHKGEEYGFTLAVIDNKKAWTHTRIFVEPPSMIRERIDLVLAVREDNIPLSGARELVTVNKILGQLESISMETDPITLVGLDKQERLVRVDRHGFEVSPVLEETSREPEYQIRMTCWGVYKQE